MGYSQLLMWQYRSKPKAVNTIKCIESEFSTSLSGLIELMNVLNIDEAQGVNLDLVGKHIGLFRKINSYQILKFFGFLGSPIALGFSRNRIGGGEWYRNKSPQYKSVKLEDDDYRFLLKCKILKNYQAGTLSNIYEACRFIFGQGCEVIDNLDMSVSVLIPNKNITDFKRFAIKNLDILPRQCGVSIHYSIEGET